MAESYPQINANKTIHKITFFCVFLTIALVAGAFVIFGDDSKKIDRETYNFVIFNAKSYLMSYPDAKCVVVSKDDIEIYKCYSPSVTDRCKDPSLYIFLKDLKLIDFKLIQVCI